MKSMVLVSTVFTILACAPASAAIENVRDDNLELTALSLSDEVDTPRADICVRPDTQFIPSFVRNLDGVVVGINYTIVEYTC